MSSKLRFANRQKTFFTIDHAADVETQVTGPVSLPLLDLGAILIRRQASSSAHTMLLIEFGEAELRRRAFPSWSLGTSKKRSNRGRRPTKKLDWQAIRLVPKLQFGNACLRSSASRIARRPSSRWTILRNRNEIDFEKHCVTRLASYLKSIASTEPAEFQIRYR